MRKLHWTKRFALGGAVVVALAAGAALGGRAWSDIERDVPRPHGPAVKKPGTGPAAGGGGEATFRGGWTRTGEGAGKLTARPKVLWTAHAGHDIGFPGQPILAHGKVFSGSGDSNVYAFDGKSGKELWHYRTGSGVYTSPTYADGLVYAGSYDRFVYALTADTGKLKWKFETDGLVEGAVCVMGGVVYVPSFDGFLYALDAKTGKKKWSYNAGGEVHASPACVGDVVYVGADDSHGGFVAAVNRGTGKEKWVYELDGGDQVSLAVAISGKTGVIAGTGGRVYAFDAATGKERWTAAGPSGMSHHAVAVHDGLVVACGSDSCKAFDLGSGAKRWTASVSGTCGAPAAGGGLFYVPRNASGGSQVVGLDGKTGKTLWSIDMDGSCRTSLGLFDGVLLHGTEIGNLYALGGKGGPDVAVGPGSDPGPSKASPPKGGGPKPAINCDKKLSKSDIPSSPLRGWVDGRSWEFGDGAAVKKGGLGDIYLINHPYKSRCSVDFSDPDDSVEVGIFLNSVGPGSYLGTADVEFINYREPSGDIVKDNSPNIAVMIDDGDFSSGWVSGSIAACFEDGSWIAGEFSVPACKE